VQSISEYDILEQIYSGSKAVICRAADSRTGQRVILKRLKAEYPAPENLAKYKREYEIAKGIDGPGIVRPLALVPDNNSVVIVMEDIGGVSLHHYAAGSPLDLGRFLDIGVQLADALGNLHQQKVIHKDLKPHNVIVNPETLETKIIDFGIASLLPGEQQEMLAPEQLEGTLAYMSPEQTGRMNRAIDYRTDFYSLGVTFYQLLTGELPFGTSDPVELIHCHIARQPQPPAERNLAVPRALSEIVMRLLAKDAQDRYQSAYGLRRDLEQSRLLLQDEGQIRDFAIGQEDKSEIFLIPARLYGRERDLETLRSVFERVCQGWSEGVLVSGFSGIGKSALVHELHKEVIRERGFFITGKFDQFKRHLPYNALIQALRQLMNRLLTESEERLALWRDKILQAIGPIGEVLTDVIPELELIIGRQPAVSKLPPPETQNRFQLAMQNLLGVFAREEHPLVMFFDDLQWADPASLYLIEFFLSDLSSSYLLFLGAYRDNEVTAADRVMRMTEELRQKKRSLHQICLTPLEPLHVRQLLADTLQCAPGEVTPLAEEVLQKTGGNPFFVKQFLQGLYGRKLVVFDHERGEWRWDLGAIREEDITDNVVEFMTGKIKTLPPFTQEVLQFAACIGSTFDFQTLAMAVNQTVQETAADLWSALEEGLLVPVGTSYKLLFAGGDDQSALPEDFNVRFTFLHDRVQQVAYALLPEAARKAVHWQIGQLMLGRIRNEEIEDGLFDMVNHLNEGRELIITEADREQLMILNLAAGIRAKASTAYEPALKYLRQGVELLDANAWEDQYRHAYSLYLERSEVEYLCGHFEVAEDCFELVMQKARTILEKAYVYNIKTVLYIAQGRYEEVIRLGLECINMLGIRMSSRRDKWRTFVEVLKARWNLRGRTIDELFNLPFVQNPYRNEAMKVMFNIATAAYFIDQNLFSLLNMKTLNMTLKHGNSVFSSLSYGGYAVVLGSVFGDYGKGYAFGKMAADFADHHFPDLKSKSDFSFATFCNHWVMPLRTNIDYYKVGYEHSLQSGDMLYAFFSALHKIHCMVFAGLPLEEVHREIDTYFEIQRRSKLQDFTDNYLLVKAMVSALRGLTDGPTSLTDSTLDESDYLAKMEGNRYLAQQSYYYLCKAKLLYHYDEPLAALELVRTMEGNLLTFFGQPLVPEHAFFHALILCASHGHVPRGEQRRAMAKLKKIRKKFENWSLAGPENFRHKFLLVSAEIARLQGQERKAMDLYDGALADAQEHGFVQHVALAAELAAKFYDEQGKDKIARLYMTEAHYGYLKWGATAKARDLETRWPHLLRHSGERESSLEAAVASSATVTSSKMQGGIDLMTVMKASRAISGQIVLSRLLETMMTIVVENAGAEKAILLFEQDGELSVEAEFSAGETVQVLQSVPFAQFDGVPHTVVQFVRRLKERVVVHDTSDAEMFAKDAYIREQQPKSMLCLPFLNQGRLVGVLYLENRLTRHAFTEGRFEILNLLSTQIATAIENARLYEQQVQLVESYGKFVPHQFLRFLNKQSITDVHVGDSVQMEMSVLFSDIRSFTSMSEGMTPAENFRFLNEYLRKMEPCILENRGFIDKYIGDAIMSLFDKGADDAVRAAIAMLFTVCEYNTERRQKGRVPIEIGIGINSGLLMLGTLGGQHRMDSTVISDTVNLASRIGDLTKLYGVRLLIGEETYRRLLDPTRYSIRLLDRVRVRGKTNEVVVYEVFDADPAEVRDGKLRSKEDFEQAIERFQSGRYAEAELLFCDCAELTPGDVVARIYVERCRSFLMHGYESPLAELTARVLAASAQ
jgi:predicted ATPase/class 3 adenylate cyclase/GAF domain-containing protein/tRNA A-37 threonylcarbamoyl transferase component Bud32